jgi:hypothetical protein
MPPPPVSLLSFVDCVPLTKRGLDKETTELFGYGVGNYNGSTVQVATYRNQRGKDVAQQRKRSRCCHTAGLPSAGCLARTPTTCCRLARVHS